MDTNPKPEISVHVDPANPGQFFACCGLLELADRLWDGAEGWFQDDVFKVLTKGTLEELLKMLVKDLPAEVTSLEKGLTVKPLIAPLRLSLGVGDRDRLTLDAWMVIRTEKQKLVAAANPPWNFWSGQQTPLRIWTTLRDALRQQLEELKPSQYDDLFSLLVPLPGRFGFDPGAAWNALDVGFSPNEQDIPVSSSPATESLAAIGIQRFRPLLSDDRMTFEYSTWGQPLPPSVASGAASGIVEVGPRVRFRGRVISRGSYAALGYSIQIERSE
ncbi:hypothetical protein [Candidatus Nitrospira inopinata]|uniref:Uncharacterized protein n=1 Tax=Candidatus Nitrospira inopinata TaxID=1715989 RepID=A0A0S4KUK0_9BACT|nr:hypothetical protein [Candidatus Nitrospira inopinata]CUQ67471.1 conserved protein of unknown function [Candidatus Nitrospira inopinata]